MGKPFIKELENIPQTLRWAFAEPIHDSLEKIVGEFSDLPLFIVGSGGSLSCAHFIARLHERETGKMCRAITPFELLFLDVNPSSHGILIVTAGGNNKDIINALEVAIRKEFVQIAVSCSSLGSKIAALSKEYPYIRLFEYNNPTGKDGFLAVNTLLSTCVLFAKAYGAIDTATEATKIQQLVETRQDLFDESWDRILNHNTLVALGGEWSWPALTDLESKCTEAGLRNVLITDLKNFSHGRHTWFDKKGDESALLILETPPLAALSKKITALLPPQYPAAVLSTRHSGPLAAIDLFIQIFYLVQRVGVLSNIDPGRPQVPEFGRKMYHTGLPLSPIRKKTNRDAWLARKAHASNRSLSALKPALVGFLTQFQNKSFPGIIFDYDGTLCDNAERFTRPKPEIATALNKLLSKGILIGIATGRGRSVQRSLLEVINEKFQSRIIVGNYNGALVSKLTDAASQANGSISPQIQKAYQLIKEDSYLWKEIETEPRSKQISVTSKGHASSQTIFHVLHNVLSSIETLRIVQSSHSIDILDSDVSKVRVVEVLRSMLPPASRDILVVGDQGQIDGNDFDLLNRPYSLSVDKVTPSLSHCWNLSPLGRRGADATLAIINAMEIQNGSFHLNTDLLEREKG
jgi:HAD superfamily hydrolase (TIGR01484 family)